jgi:putative SOS response-associated peptidase YedK
MCGRVAIRHAVQDVEQTVGAPLLEREIEPVARYNVGPGQPILAVRADTVRRVDRELIHLLWGLIPPWAKSPKDGAGPLANARAETASQKPSFRHALRRRRCVVPVSGFYEWKREGAAKPQPHYFSDPTGNMLLMAGIWEIWHGPGGEVLETACVLTRSAEGIMEGIHDRMPVLLPRQRLDEWLDPTLETAPADLLESNLAAHLIQWSVSTEVNSIRNDGPHLIEPIIPEPNTPPSPSIGQDDLFG